MVSDEIKIRDKWRVAKKFLKVFFIFLAIIIILGAVYFSGFYLREQKNSNIVNVVLENPMKNIVYSNTNNGTTDQQEVIERGILEFDENYINFLLIALGADKLKKSLIGYGNPVLEMNLDGEIWSSEIIESAPNTIKQAIDNEDLIIIISREEAVKALLSQDIKQFLKDSVSNGNTKLEIVAGKVELLSKGYLSMHKELTGKEG